MCMGVLLHVCLYTNTCMVSAEAIRGCQIPWNWLQVVLSHHVDARNQTWVFWKSSQCFLPLSYLSISPSM